MASNSESPYNKYKFFANTAQFNKFTPAPNARDEIINKA
jgi:hypothetical protein